MSFAMSSSYSSQRAVTASCAAKSRSSWDCGARLSLPCCCQGGAGHGGVDQGWVARRGSGCRGLRHRKRDRAAAASGRLRRLELGLGVQHLEASAMATARATLPGATDARHHAHEREDEPPVAADELEDGLHPVMLTVAGRHGAGGLPCSPRGAHRTGVLSSPRGRCRRPHPRHGLRRPGDRALGTPQQVLRGIGPVAELVAERLRLPRGLAKHRRPRRRRMHSRPV